MASTVYDPEICIGAFSMLISDPSAKNNVKMTRMLVLSPVTLCYITNWKPRIATVHSCFDLVGSRQHGVASNEVISWSTDDPESQMQIFTDWPLSHAKRATKDNRKSPEYHVVAAIRKLRTDKNCPAEKSKVSVITAPEKFENTAYFLQLGLPSTLITKNRALQKRPHYGRGQNNCTT